MEVNVVEVWSVLMIALFLIAVVERVTEAFFSPICERFKIDTKWLMYVAWILGGVIVYLANVNLFDFAEKMDPRVGQVLTAIVAGGGSNLLHDLFSNMQRRTNLIAYNVTKPTPVTMYPESVNMIEGGEDSVTSTGWTG